MNEIRLATQARFFASMAHNKPAVAVLEINANEERVALYGFDAYQDAEEKGVDMEGLIVNPAAFKSVILDWLAWHLGIEDESRIHDLPTILDELERYRAAFEVLDEAFDDVPSYMGDEHYGDQLLLTLAAARDLAKWKSISLTEFRDELDTEAGAA